MLSVLNGISSEEMLGRAFGPEKVVWCVAQKMSTKKEGNQAHCDPTGELAIGVPAGADRTSLDRLTAFFDRIGFAYSLPADIRTHMWGKLMCNTGRQSGGHGVSVRLRRSPGARQGPGHHDRRHGGGGRQWPPREGVTLTQADIDGWVAHYGQLSGRRRALHAAGRKGPPPQ